MNLKDLTKEELINRLQKLEAHAFNLENIVTKHKQPIKKLHSLDFSRYKLRHVAFKLSYLGWEYQGLQRQDVTPNTITESFLDALVRCKLIENKNVKISLCGRTDKGVCALGQVVALPVRSYLLEGLGMISETGPNADQRTKTDIEIDFPYILNKVLPRDIRVLGWSPVPIEFDARRSCKERAYRYYFPRDFLDFDLMSSAIQKLIGINDYRNFCSSQVKAGVFEYIREVKSIAIETSSSSILTSFDNIPPDEIICLHITAPSFLYHQIRSMVTFIMIVGKGFEEPSIINELLEVSKFPCRPQYKMAADFPLLFCDTKFEDLEWNISENAHKELIKFLQIYSTELSIKNQTMKTILSTVTEEFLNKNPSSKTANFWLNGIVEEAATRDNESFKFKAIHHRPTGPSIEEQIMKLGGKETIRKKIMKEKATCDPDTVQEPEQKKLRVDNEPRF